VKDTSLLNELEVKVKILVDNLRKEREKKNLSSNFKQESTKLIEIKEKINNILKIVDQFDKLK
tara:strand:- start:154 stop:342 length:189 start_codon:yes stop_codon:yes gene_type:complete